MKKKRSDIMKRMTFLLVLFLLCGCTVYRTTNLPEEMPADFSFSVHWGFSGNYDSKTQELKDGFNYDLDCECKTQLELTVAELEEIYQIIRNAKIDSYNKEIMTERFSHTPSADMVITFHCGDIDHSVTLFGAYLTDNMNEYLGGKEVGMAIKEIVQNYIINTEEFKSLPEDQQVFE
jgi:hypothetical protein